MEIVKLSKKDIENIIGRELLDCEYEVIVKSIQARKENKKLIECYARQEGRTRLRNEITLLNAILPERVIFDELRR